MDTDGSIHPHAFPSFAPPSRHRGTESGGGVLCLSPPHPPRRAPQHDGASYRWLCPLSFSIASLPGDCYFSNRYTLLYYTHRHDGSILYPIIVPSWRSYIKRPTCVLSLTASPPTPLQGERGGGASLPTPLQGERGVITFKGVRTTIKAVPTFKPSKPLKVFKAIP